MQIVVILPSVGSLGLAPWAHMFTSCLLKRRRFSACLLCVVWFNQLKIEWGEGPHAAQVAKIIINFRS